MKLLLTIILLLSLVAPAKAEMNCGTLAEFNTFYKDALNNSDASEGLMAGYFQGYTAGWASGDDGRYFKIPSGVDDAQIAHVIGKWLQAHPEKWHLAMNQCIFFALHATWPSH